MRRLKIMEQAIRELALETINKHGDLKVDVKLLDLKFIKRVLNNEHKMPLIVAVEKELYRLK